MAEKMKFDPERYRRESEAPDFKEGRKAFREEKYDRARELFGQEYDKGSALAATRLGEIYYTGYGCKRDREKAVELFSEGRDRGCPLSADWLALACSTGNGVPEDGERAKELCASCQEALEAMCEAGSDEAQYAYGYDLVNGTMEAENAVEKGFSLLEKSMAAGNVCAAAQIALAYLSGWGGVEIDEERAADILEKYAWTTDSNIHFGLGYLYTVGAGGKKRDIDKALEHYRIPAEKEDVDALRNMGELYYSKYLEEGWAEENLEEARKWYELAWQQGDDDAALWLGRYYLEEVGGKEGREKSEPCLKQAVAAGAVEAMYKLGSAYLFGGEYEEAEKYLKMAAEQGDIMAQELLAECYAGEYYVFPGRDLEKSVYWYQKLAEEKDDSGYYRRMVGKLYAEGDGDAFPKSYPEAVKWLCAAAEKGSTTALVDLARVYHAGDNPERDEEKAEDYIRQTEDFLKGEFHGSVADTHAALGDYYMETDETKKKLAFEHYVEAYPLGGKDVPYKMFHMYFLEGFRSDRITVSLDELIEMLKREEETNGKPGLAQILAEIYEKGLEVPKDGEEAAKWRAVAEKKEAALKK